MAEMRRNRKEQATRRPKCKGARISGGRCAVAGHPFTSTRFPLQAVAFQVRRPLSVAFLPQDYYSQSNLTSSCLQAKSP